FVSDVDETFNEVAGIRLPDVAVPVTTNTGWNPRDTSVGNEELLIGITGGLAGWTIPLPTTEELSDRSGDPRPSIEKLYESRDSYILKVQDSVSELVSEGYILEEDVDGIIEKAIFRYDDIIGP
ncbi:MAG: alpha/beta hydrolase domain-containing protein, partial [Chloroflexota bacterium]|nr:alpha/beta hydrolase domain-containing protein [Chloroflexota bacterium]